MKFYHVTRALDARHICADGLRPFHFPNWERASGGRYGEPGFVYAFTDRTDALRWAAIMDWSFNGETGSGRIAIVNFTANPSLWEDDDGDPLRQAGAKGRWVRSRHAVLHTSIHSFELVDREKLQTLKEVA